MPRAFCSPSLGRVHNKHWSHLLGWAGPCDPSRVCQALLGDNEAVSTSSTPLLLPGGLRVPGTQSLGWELLGDHREHL